MTPRNITLHTYLKELALREPHKKMLGNPSWWLDAQTVLERVESAACCLCSQRIDSGSFVALRTTRTVETVITMLALQAIGAVAVLTDAREEPMAFLKNRGLEIPVEHSLDAGQLNIFSLPSRSFPKREIDPKAPGFIIFTSGSTGNCKAVVLSQDNVISSPVDADPFGYYLDGDLALGVLPLDHVFGLVLLAGVFVIGYALYLPDKMDIPSILEAIQKEHLTRMNGVPSLYLGMAAQKEGYDLSSLRAGFIGGGPCTPEQFWYIEKELDITLVSAYGMSECVSITTTSHLDSQEKRATTVGRFYPRSTGKILLEDGSEAPVGVEGEICVDSPSRMLGYYGEPSSTEPLLATGDLGYVDEDGFVHISGRKKDIIIRNGNNLSARRIEEAILSIPGIQDAAVVGLPHETQGEAPWAMAAGSLTEPVILARLSELLAKNELPMGIRMVEELPRTASGKPDKQRIREVLGQWKA